MPLKKYHPIIIKLLAKLVSLWHRPKICTQFTNLLNFQDLSMSKILYTNHSILYPSICQHKLYFFSISCLLFISCESCSMLWLFMLSAVSIEEIDSEKRQCTTWAVKRTRVLIVKTLTSLVTNWIGKTRFYCSL